MVRSSGLAATLFFALSAASAPALALDDYDLWIWSEDRARGDDEAELVVIVNRETEAAAAARRSASGDLIWTDAKAARAELGELRRRSNGVAVVEIGDALHALEKTDKRQKDSGDFHMHIDGDSVSIRIGDGLIIEADEGHAFIAIDDEVVITAKDGDDGALVIIGGLDADDAEDAIDDLDDASRDLKRRMKRAIGL